MEILASGVANYFLKKSWKERCITGSKLNSLVYIANGWCLAATGKGITDDVPIAERFGPIIPSVHHQVRRYFRSPVLSSLVELNEDWEPLTVKPPNDKTVIFLLNYVWTIYRPYSSHDLIEMTTEKGTPWMYTRDYGRSKQIPDKVLKAYYKREIRGLLGRVEARKNKCVPTSWWRRLWRF